jgi:hypothetical protein
MANRCIEIHDYRAIDIGITRNGVSNSWRQSLPIGSLKQLTHFNSELGLRQRGPGMAKRW